MARDPASFFRTPAWVAELLFKAEKFKGEIWEPCCGDGAISEVARVKGYKVYSSDLYDYGYGEAGINFLGSHRKAECIVSNPPYERCMDFVERALTLASGKVALLMEQRFLSRRSHLFRGRLARYYPIGKVNFPAVPYRKCSATATVAWFVFRSDYRIDYPTVRWFHN